MRSNRTRRSAAWKLGPYKNLVLKMRPHEYELIKRACYFQDISIQSWCRDHLISLAKVDDEEDMAQALLERRRVTGR